MVRACKPVSLRTSKQNNFKNNEVMLTLGKPIFQLHVRGVKGDLETPRSTEDIKQAKGIACPKMDSLN
jgi:hypothetical protein